MRRLLAGAAATGLGLVLALAPLAAPMASAQESIPASYAGSRITTPASSTSSSPPITALITRSYNSGLQTLVIQSFITPPSGLPSGCPGPSEVELSTQVAASGQPNTAQSTAIGSAPCNGTYKIRIVATLKSKLGGGTVDKATLIGQVNVVAPPAAVTGVGATFDGAAVGLTWDAYLSPPKDFLGYRVQRQNGDDWTTLGDVGPTTTNVADNAPPPEGGKVTYRVLARRGGPGAPITCDCGGKTSIDLPVGATTTTSTEPGQGGGGGGGGTAGNTDGGGNGGGNGSGGAGGTGGATSTTVAGGASNGGGGKKPAPGGRTFGALPKGQVGVGTKAPRLGTATGANVPDLLTPDSGFSEELDYGDLGGGDEEGENGLSSFYYEGAGGRGMAVPVATGFVLFAWAFHLRYLARASKPVPARGKRSGKARGGRSAKGSRSKSAAARRPSNKAPAKRRTAPPKRGWAYR